MGRFDQRDPGQDPDYCDGLDPRESVLPSGRPCDVCPHTAWLVNVGPDGFGHYQCNQGHLVIVAQPRQGAA